MESLPLFWCVWCEDGGSPTVKHATYAKAKGEAKRLARLSPGSRFVVLAAAVAYQKRDLDEIRYDMGHPSFDDDPDWRSDHRDDLRDMIPF